MGILLLETFTSFRPDLAMYLAADWLNRHTKLTNVEIAEIITVYNLNMKEWTIKVYYWWN